MRKRKYIVSNLSGNEQFYISKSEAKEIFIHALCLDSQYTQDKLRDKKGELPCDNILKDSLYEEEYTLREIYKAIREDDGSGNELITIMSRGDKFHINVWEYANRFFREEIWDLIDSCHNNNNHIEQNKSILEDQLEKEFKKLFNICKPMVKKIFTEDNKTSDDEIRLTKRIFLSMKDKMQHQLQRYVSRDINLNKFTLIEVVKIHIYAQIISFVNLCTNITPGDGENDYQEAVYYIAFYLLSSYVDKKIPLSSEGAFYGNDAIKVGNITDQQEAFNNYGICAIEEGDKQLAFDIYYTWVNKVKVGQLRDISLPNFNTGKGNYNYRCDHNLDAIIFNNFAYVCSEIALCYDYDDNRRKEFYDLAKEGMEKAIGFEGYIEPFYCTYGDILCENAELEEDNYRKAMEQYEKYKEHSSGVEEVEALRSEMSTLLRFLMAKYMVSDEKEICTIRKGYRKYYNVFWEKLDEYQKQAQECFKDSNEDSTNERELWKEWESTFHIMYDIKRCVGDPNIYQDLFLLLLMIQETANSIKYELRWKDYNSDTFSIHNGIENKNSTDENGNTNNDSKVIGYYTTLRTVSYLFDEMIQDTEDCAPHPKDADSTDEGINCMTVMHASYMNDPYEGLALLNELNIEINRNIENKNNKKGNTKIDNIIWQNDVKTFRGKIYEKNFVFLKAFTDREDYLLMWNRYASDASVNGQDSNGCFVELDNKSFGMSVSTNDVTNHGDSKIYQTGRTEPFVKKKGRPEDDYNLYRVVYVSENGHIDKEKNPKISQQVGEYYDLLKTLVCELNRYLCEIDARNIRDDDRACVVDYVTDFLQQALRFIIFLFKEDDYSDEQESRIVFTRDVSQQKLIRLIPGNPSKLCINPYFQIYIKKIIFGPNVRKVEEWQPYFQYQINNMWLKHPDIKRDASILPRDKYKIKTSDTHYRTYGDDEG